MRSNNNLFSTLVRWAILMVLVSTGLLVAAGTTHLPMLKAYIVALAPSLLVMMLAIAPQIAQERGSADDGKYDERARLALVALFLVTIVMAALDVGRLHLSNRVPLALSIFALVIYVAGSGFQAWAMSVNSFYSPIIHIQAERGMVWSLVGLIASSGIPPISQILLLFPRVHLPLAHGSP